MTLRSEDLEERKIKKLILAVHIFLWFIVYVMLLNSILTEAGFLDAVIYGAMYLIPTAFPFYINYFWLTRFLFISREYIKYFLFISLVIAVPFMLISVADLEWLFSDQTTFSPMLDIAIYYILFILISNFVKGLEIWLTNRRREELLLREKLQAELNFLRLQINPHFLFNTLNNIYSLAYRKDDKTPEMISRLSHILRYMLYECKGERVPIIKELELVNNYISLQQLKLGEERNIDVYSEGIDSKTAIAPLLLITILENCFKHSDIEVNEKAWITVDFILNNKEFTFKVANSTGYIPQSEQPYSGIGVANLTKQLGLIYPERYSLESQQQEDSFETCLKIELD